MTYRVHRMERVQILRELISDANSETPRTAEDGTSQVCAVRFLQRKLDEASREVMNGD